MNANLDNACSKDSDFSKIEEKMPSWNYRRPTPDKDRT